MLDLWRAKDKAPQRTAPHAHGATLLWRRAILAPVDGRRPPPSACHDGRVHRIVPCIGVPQPAWRGDFPSRIPSLLRGCRVDEDSQRRYAPWVVRYEQVLALRARHVHVADIARMVRVSRQVVYRYLSLDGPPSCKRHATRRRTLLDPYKEYLLSRWDDGCRNAAQLWREIQALGFAYSYTNISRFLAQYRPP